MERMIIHHPHVILIHYHFSFSSQVHDGNITIKMGYFMHALRPDFLMKKLWNMPVQNRECNFVIRAQFCAVGKVQV